MKMTPLTRTACLITLLYAILESVTSNNGPPRFPLPPPVPGYVPTPNNGPPRRYDSGGYYPKPPYDKPYPGGATPPSYNPYNPYPYPYPYPSYPYPNPVNPNRNGNPVIFSMSRATKNNECLNLETCFLQFAETTTKINAITFPSYGAFQAPTPGYYYFTITVSLPANSNTLVSLHKNNDVVAGLSSANSTVQQTATQSIVLTLNAQDAVYMVLESGDVTENLSPNAPLNSFSGFLIASITRSQTTGSRPGTSSSNNGLPGTGSSNTIQSNPSVTFENTRFNMNPMRNSMPPFLIGQRSAVETETETENEDDALDRAESLQANDNDEE